MKIDEEKFMKAISKSDICKKGEIKRLLYQSEIEEDVWIPCSERLPNKEERVIAKDIFKHVYVGHIYEGSFGDIYISDDDYDFRQRDIVAWKPLS